MIEFIYFDLGNVLLLFDHEIACRNLASVSDRDADQIRRIVFESDLQARYETGQIDTSEFHRVFCEALGVETDLDTTVAAASDIFSVNHAIVPLIVQLNSTSHRPGILSDTCDAHWQLCWDRYTMLRELFSVYALSYQLGAAKPNAEIYQRAIELAQVPAEKIFFVDDREDNVQGALDAGMDAVPFTSVPKLVADLSDRGIEVNH